MIGMSGAAGLGLVLGWVMVSAAGRGARNWRPSAIVVWPVGLAIVLVEVAWITQTANLWASLVGILAGAWTCSAWREWMIGTWRSRQGRTMAMILAGTVIAAAPDSATAAGQGASVAATTLQLWGAGCFGVLVGWYVYYINRYRKGDVQMSDVVTLLGVIGGGAVTALFPVKSDFFGAYGIGLAIGFFGYFLVLLMMVGASKKFDVNWFLDGRRKKPAADEIAPDLENTGSRPMDGDQ